MAGYLLMGRLSTILDINNRHFRYQKEKKNLINNQGLTWYERLSNAGGETLLVWYKFYEK